jgi:pantoate--beta-alanine ligase
VSLPVVPTIAELRSDLDAARAEGRSIGFVPTMGFLHDGHLSLARRARRETDLVVMSLFVNPLQFGPSEDLSTYPRDLERDRRLAQQAGVDLLFAPDAGEMYPEGQVRTTVTVSELSERWEGATRPTHFAGVATVVTKLFAIVGPSRAYFGEKDYQQLQVVTRLVADLSLPVEVVGCATVREPDGLAMSSRNIHLSVPERAAATVLVRALDAGAAAVAGGERRPATVEAVMAGVLDAEPLAKRDYVAVVDPATLAVPDRLEGESRLLVAAWVGTTRLIDNRAVPSVTAPDPTDDPGVPS